MNKKVLLLASAFMIVSLSFIFLTGCSNSKEKEFVQPSPSPTISSSPSISSLPTTSSLPNKSSSPATISSSPTTTVTGSQKPLSTKATPGANKASDSNVQVAKDNFDWYFGLIGLHKEKLIFTLNETPVSVDEAGLSFKKAGIRVWFKDYGKGQVVDQIFTQRTDINFNGAKVGDSISSFIKVFGEPLSDKNSDAHFKYKDMILSVQYDENTQKSIAIYFLKNDF